MNIALIQGNIGKEVEVKDITGGKVANFSVATNESYKNKAGEWVDKTEWHNVVCFGYLADKAAKMSKGNSVLIEGKLETQKWQDKDGNNRYTTRIIAKFLRSMEKKESGGSGFPNKEPKTLPTEQEKKFEAAQTIGPETSKPWSGNQDDLPF